MCTDFFSGGFDTLFKSSWKEMGGKYIGSVEVNREEGELQNTLCS